MGDPRHEDAEGRHLLVQHELSLRVLEVLVGLRQLQSGGLDALLEAPVRLVDVLP